ncbi:MAG: hypothetical protein HC882_01440 [Acidobacteria bacterium]|nr:hypothetical protein [Acidobacteriota bacterium]
MTRPALDLPPVFNGINRLEGQSYGRPDGRCAHALNVETALGEVQRRRGMCSFTTGPAFLRPAGASNVSNGSVILGRSFNASAQFYVGSHSMPEAFTGFWFGPMTWAGTLTRHLLLRVEFWNGSAWAPIPWVLDNTQEVRDGYIAPLLREGAVCWRKRELIDLGWVPNTIAGLLTYWVNVTFTTLEGVSVDAAGTRSVLAPGIRLIDLEPVNGLYEGAPGNASALLVCADRQEVRGRELGGNVGVYGSRASATLPVLFEELREAGWSGTPTIPTWAGGTQTLPGTAGSLRKLTVQTFSNDVVPPGDVPYEWRQNEWTGGLITRNRPTGAGSTATLVNDVALAGGTNAWEHCRLSLRGAAAVAADSLVEVFASSGNDVRVFPALSAAPTSDTWDLLGPPKLAMLWPEMQAYEIRSNNEHELVLVPASLPFARSPADLGSTWLGQFSIMQESRWRIRLGRRWSFANNPVTRRVVMANGGDILETNGESINLLTADNSSDLAQYLAGEAAKGTLASLKEDAQGALGPQGVFRSTPPKATYVAVFQGRMFAAYEDVVYWSFPNAAIDIWGFTSNTIVRSAEKSNVTGLWPLNNSLVVSTLFGLFEMNEVDSNVFSPIPVAQSGFVSQQAATVVAREGAMILAGVMPDGIGAWNGSALQMILDDWDAVLDQPVNASRLDRSSAAWVPATQQCFFAVPVGSEEWPTRILVREADTQRWWLWSTPWGVSSLSASTDDGGGTRLLIGTVDGFVATLADAPADDGTSIRGEIQTQNLVIPQGARGAVTSFLTTARAMGTGTAEIELFGDSDPEPLKRVSDARFVSPASPLASRSSGFPGAPAFEARPTGPKSIACGRPRWSTLWRLGSRARPGGRSAVFRSSFWRSPREGDDER